MPIDSYWAAGSADEIGEQLLTRVNDYDNNSQLLELRARQARAYMYYYGLSPNGVHATSQVLRGGDVGELAEVRVNHSRAIVSTLQNLITSNKIVWQPKATANTDAAVLRECELAQAMLEYYWADKKVGLLSNRALENALVAGEGFVLVSWDRAGGEDYLTGENVVKTGDVRFTLVNSQRVIRDIKKTSWDELDWVIVKRYVNRWSLAALYPQQAAEIHGSVEADDERNSGGKTVDVDSDDVALYDFYHKRTPALPNGRQLQFLADGTVLTEEDNPNYDLQFDEIPLYRLAAAELDTTCFGYTPYFDILGVQELMDSLHTSVATNQSTLATQCIAVQEGSEIPFDQIAGGMTVIYYKPGTEPPRPLQLLQTPTEVFNYIGQLEKAQAMLVGINDVVRGNMPSANATGAGMALLDTAALRQSSVLHANWLNFVQGLGQCLLYTMQRRATLPQKIALVGRSSPALMDVGEITGASIGNVKKVLVETGNPMAQTAAGRFDIAKDLAQMLGPEKLNVDQLIQVMQTGQLKPVTGSLSDQFILIQDENEAMLRGEAPPVLVTDHHMLHIRGHAAALNNTQIRKQPEVVQAVLRHMDEHDALYHAAPATLLAASGQQPPPVMPPLPGGPPQGGPGGPGGPPGAAGAPAAPAPPGEGPPGKLPNLPQMPQDPRTGERHDPTAVGQPGPVKPPQ